MGRDERYPRCLKDGGPFPSATADTQSTRASDAGDASDASDAADAQTTAYDAHFVDDGLSMCPPLTKSISTDYLVVRWARPPAAGTFSLESLQAMAFYCAGPDEDLSTNRAECLKAGDINFATRARTQAVAGWLTTDAPNKSWTIDIPKRAGSFVSGQAHHRMQSDCHD